MYSFEVQVVFSSVLMDREFKILGSLIKFGILNL